MTYIIIILTLISLLISGLLIMIYKKMSELTDIAHDSEIDLQSTRMLCKRILEISLGGKHRRKVKSEYEAQLDSLNQEAAQHDKTPYREVICYMDSED